MTYNEAKARKIANEAMLDVSSRLDAYQEALFTTGYFLCVNTTANGQYTWDLRRLIKVKADA